MNPSSSKTSGDEPIASLRHQARCALEKFRHQRSRLVQTGQKPPKLKPRRVRIPYWTVAVAARVLDIVPDTGTNTVVAKTTGGHMAAAVLSQLLFWLLGVGRNGKPRAHEPDYDRGLDHPWIGTTAAELAGQIGATRKRVEPCMAALRANCWIGSHAMRYRGKGRLRGLVVSHIWLGPRSLEMVEKLSRVSGNPPAMWLSLWSMLGTDGDINAALVMSRLYHLARRQRDAGISHDDAFRVTNEELRERLMLSLDQIKRAKAVLRERGLIEMPGRSLVVVNVEFCAGLAVMSANRTTEHHRRDESKSTS